MDEQPAATTDWRNERRAGIGAIAVAMLVAAALWIGLYKYLPPLTGMEEVGARMLVALKCLAIATLFCFVAGVEAVAHERLQSPAFDPLVGHDTRRLRVNLRYLQNTLEQLIVLAAALLGLAAYLDTGESVRAVLATAIVWIVSRFAFWIGYHRSAAMRGVGAPGMMATMLALLYVAWRIGDEFAGSAAGWAFIAAFLVLEGILFRATRARS